MFQKIVRNNQTYVKASGTFRYIRKKMNMFGKYTLCFYPDDITDFSKLNLKNTRRHDEDGDYYNLSSPEPFTLLDATGGPLSTHPGNGSRGMLYLVISSLRNKKGMPYTKARIHKILFDHVVKVPPSSFSSLDIDAVFENWPGEVLKAG